MITVLAVATVAALVAWRWRRGRARDTGRPAGLWPWVLAEVELRAAAAHPDVDLSAVALGVLLDGPARTRVAVSEAVRTCGAAAPAGALLAATCDRLASADADRLRALVATNPRATVSGDHVAWARAAAVGSAAHRAAWASAARVGLAGRWLLLTPLAAVATGAVSGARAGAVAVLAVLAWALAGVWIDRAGPEVRGGTIDVGEPVAPGTG